ATERAQAVAREQAALQQRVEQLSRAVEEIARAARAAGIDDTALQARLREGQDRLQRAATPALAQRLRERQQALANAAPARTPRPPLARPARAARAARAAMGRAARAADERQAGDAQQAGQQAEQQLTDLPDQLRGERDSLAQRWREETLAALDRALSETAALAEREERVAEALRRGDASAATRSQQASAEEGTDAVGRQVREAAGRHALVSPQLEAALGFAKRQMAAAQAQLEEADVNPGEAASLAEQAVDALNATALALARSRSQVSGAQSGSGFAEAVEQLARLARDQQGVNGQAQGLLPLIGPSGQAVLAQLRALAARQRALAE